MENSAKTYATMEEAVLDMLFKQVLEQKPKKIKKTTLLIDFCPFKGFEKDMMQVYLDRTERIFGVSIKNLQNKPLQEIVQFLVQRKKKDSIYGSRPFKKKW